MKQEFRNIKGTFDILPHASSSDGTRVFGSGAWRFVEERVREVLERFHFAEIRTPILEPTELIARGIGELTDIVSKEMFAFERGDTHYVLRPEITAPVMRAYLQHRLDQRGGAARLYYLGPCFRAERPQKGRYRQFHQFGCEIMGTDDPRADVEVIAAMMAVYEAFDIQNTRLRINTLGDERSRPAYKASLQEYLLPYADELSETSRQRLETNPLRILDTKLEHERKLLQDAPMMAEFIDAESAAHFEQVKGYLFDLGIAFEEDPYLVRGLDYYTRTAFELESPDLGAQSALAGGGRYDLLAQEVGGKNAVPAVGFAAGFERLFLALEAANTPFPEEEGVDVFIVALGAEAERWAVRCAQSLRRVGLRVAFDLEGRSMKAQMKEANRQSARLTIIAGEREMADGRVQVKDMATGVQQDVPVEDLAAVLPPRVRHASDD